MWCSISASPSRITRVCPPSITTSSLLLTDLLRICGDILPSAILDLNLEFIITTSETEPLTEFTCFSEFPLEIRRLIWTTSCMVTRTLDLALRSALATQHRPYSTYPKKLTPKRRPSISSSTSTAIALKVPRRILTRAKCGQIPCGSTHLQISCTSATMFALE